jgi:hypothetical protein
MSPRRPMSTSWTRGGSPARPSAARRMCAKYGDDASMGSATLPRRPLAIACTRVICSTSDGRSSGFSSAIWSRSAISSFS